MDADSGLIIADLDQKENSENVDPDEEAAKQRDSGLRKKSARDPPGGLARARSAGPRALAPQWRSSDLFLRPPSRPTTCSVIACSLLAGRYTAFHYYIRLLTEQNRPSWNRIADMSTRQRVNSPTLGLFCSCSVPVLFLFLFLFYSRNEGKKYLTAPEFWLSEREEEGEAAFEEAEEDFFTNELSGELDELELDFAFPLRIPCAAHVFENTLVAALKSDMANESFKLLKNLIGRFNRSFEAKHELRKYEQVGFIAPSTTRWGYWIDVVERFLEIEKGVRKVSERKGWPFPDAKQLTFLKEILPILQPFKEILREVQGEQFVSISNAFIYVKMAKSVLNGVKITLFESALDPNTISMLDENEISRAASYIISMITMPSQENPSPKNAHIQSSSSLESFRAHFKQARERSRSASGDKLTAQAITNEALKFLNDCPGNIDPIVYWNSAKKELEPVKELAFKIFAIPATAAPIERVWSKAGSATVHQRSLTKYELLNDQLIVYVNEYLNPQLFKQFTLFCSCSCSVLEVLTQTLWHGYLRLNPFNHVREVAARHAAHCPNGIAVHHRILCAGNFQMPERFSAGNFQMPGRFGAWNFQMPRRFSAGNFQMPGRFSAGNFQMPGIFKAGKLSAGTQNSLPDATTIGFVFIEVLMMPWFRAPKPEGKTNKQTPDIIMKGRVTARQQRACDDGASSGARRRAEE
uniref:HAT C-terminal dimerisation domain-containing protein n=1 Tax=Globodera rostochiensis TaxID=31243 RepID=A0A914HJH4_GLORO